MKKGSGMRQLLAVLLAVWMAAAGALGAVCIAIRFIFMLVGSCSLLVYNRTGAVKKEDQFQ